MVCFAAMEDDLSLPISLRRCKRQRKEVNYKEVESLKLPRAESIKPKLYPVSVTERDSDRVKIHYVGYSEDHDEWRNEEELESLGEGQNEKTTAGSPYQPFSIHSILRVKIKQALTCGRKSSPIVKISMAFDFIQFNGGLKTVGTPFKTVQGVQHFKVRKYQDLNPFLGDSWHFRGLNSNGDYGYVQLETIDFCLRRSRTLVEYFPPQDDGHLPLKSCTDTGYVLCFSFVSNYGTATTFGKDKNIFFQ